MTDTGRRRQMPTVCGGLYCQDGCAPAGLTGVLCRDKMIASAKAGSL